MALIVAYCGQVADGKVQCLLFRAKQRLQQPRLATAKAQMVSGRLAAVLTGLVNHGASLPRDQSDRTTSHGAPLDRVIHSKCLFFVTNTLYNLQTFRFLDYYAPVKDDTMDTARIKFEKLLNRSGYFVTRPRLLLFRALRKHSAMTTREILERLSRCDQATVYRNLNLFEELGIVSRLQMGWRTRFELTDAFQHHHHHLNCLKCERVIVLAEDSVLESEIARLSYKHKFKAIDHQLEIRGLCDHCA